MIFTLGELVCEEEELIDELSDLERECLSSSRETINLIKVFKGRDRY